jgi:hypothetical protein
MYKISGFRSLDLPNRPVKTAETSASQHTVEFQSYVDKAAFANAQYTTD